MKSRVVLGAGTIFLASCGGGSTAVTANSADSITTTAVGNVVAVIPSPTPTPTETPEADNATADNAPAANASSNDADATTSDAAEH